LDQVPFDTPLSLLNRKTLPSAVTVVGTGPLGVALSAFLAARKCRVNLVGRAPTVLPEEDEGLRQYIHSRLTSLGVTVWTGTSALQVRPAGEAKITVVIEQNETRHEWDMEGLGLATGLQGNTADLELEKGRIYTDGSNEIVTNEESRASRRGVWAMGSVTGVGRAFALEAFQGEQIAHNMLAPFYDKKKLEPEEPILFLLPGILAYSRVGLTEKQAVEKYKTVCATESGSYLKIIARKNGEIVGAHAVGEQSAAIGLFFEWALRAQVTMTDLAESRYFPPVTPSQDIHTCVQSWVKTYLR
jgi:mycothione reductase